MATISMSHLYNLRRSTGYRRQRTTLDNTRLLGKLRIEFTKSCPRQSNDNTLVEGKNGHMIRKLFGYTHIPQRWAETLKHFHRSHTNPYHNYHRPCLFSETLIDPRGRQRNDTPYRLSMTPYDKLKSLPRAHTFLKPGVTFQKLDALAHEITDNEAAERMNQARSRLFQTISQREFKRA